jgi:thymidylate kinase
MNIRPITIEFTGPPNSGKTTLIHNLATALQENGFSVKVMQEDAELVPKEIPKKTWARNAWITFGQLQSLIEIPYSNSQIILLDRGYCDALFWARFLRLQSACSQEQSDSLYGILKEMNTQFNLLPDWLFVIDVSVEESLKRRYALGGEIILTNEDFISLYKSELDEFYKGITSSQWYLDTTNLDISEVQNLALAKVLDILRI